MVGHLSDEKVRRLDAELMVAYRELDDLRWFDPARPHVFHHIRRVLQAIVDAYVATLQLPVDDAFAAWLSGRVDAIPRCSQRFDPIPGPWKLLPKSAGRASMTYGVFVLIAPIIGVSVVSTTLGALAIGLANTVTHVCFCKVFDFAWVTLVVATVGMLLVGFYRKRRLLMGGDAPGSKPGSASPKPNVYRGEHALLRAVGERSIGEFQADVAGWFVLAGVLVGTYAASRYFERAGFAHFAPRGTWV